MYKRIAGIHHWNMNQRLEMPYEQTTDFFRFNYKNVLNYKYIKKPCTG
jgi:hypothetical protein